MKTNLEIDAEALRSQRQSDSTAKTQPTKTVKTVAGDAAIDPEQLLGDTIDDLMYEVDVMSGALQEIRCHPDTDTALAFRSLRRIEHILWTYYMGGPSHE